MLETCFKVMCVGTLEWIAQMQLFGIVISTHFSFYSSFNTFAKTDIFTSISLTDRSIGSSGYVPSGILASRCPC